jgi:hypothetical protein
MRDVMLDGDDLEFVRGSVRAAKLQAANHVAATPRHLAAARSGAEADRDRADRILDLLARARAVFARMPEREDE